MRLKVKYLKLLTQLLPELLLLLKIKYLVLVIQSKKTDYNLKTNEIEKQKKNTNHSHDKYITTSEFNKFTAEIFDLRLKRVNLASKTYIANFVKKTDFDNELKDATSNENELNKLLKKVKAI